MATSHGRFPEFFGALAALGAAAFSPWEGDVLRATSPRWISLPFRLTGVGAVLTGGRWNVKLLMPAVYFSTDLPTLNAEADAEAIRYRWPVGSLRPQTRIALRLKLQVVLDLTHPVTLTALNLAAKDLTGCDWHAEQNAGREALTQGVARAAFELLAEGLVVPSARNPGGSNIVHFPSHRRDGTSIEAADEASIPVMHGLV